MGQETEAEQSMTIIKNLLKKMFREELDIHHRLLNLSKHGDLSVDVFLLRRSLQQHAPLVCIRSYLYMADPERCSLLLYVCAESGCNDRMYAKMLAELKVCMAD